MATLGYSCINRTASTGYNNTTMYINETFSIQAKITSWCIYTNGSCTVRLKIFRSSGSNWQFVTQGASQSASSGLNTYTEEITGINAGDYVGIWVTSGDTSAIDSEYDGSYIYIRYSGNVESDTSKSSWFDDSVTGHMSWLVTYEEYIPPTYDNVYVDINKPDDTGAGTSFPVAKKTMKAGWDILNSTGTMHVATGNYSAQATINYNKPWILSPEDPNSTGSKNVSIPKST